MECYYMSVCVSLQYYRKKILDNNNHCYYAKREGGPCDNLTFQQRAQLMPTRSSLGDPI